MKMSKPDSNEEKVLELKVKGNECVKGGNYAEAVLHYTHAIKLDENIPQLYSNRSHAFLKLQHFYYALQDAKEAVRLDPTWYKAYYRQGEVEFATKHYTEALQSYQKASQIYPDPTLLECVLRTSKEYQKQEKIFDYDYDSDEDWEDIENGESLSDSDGEADDGGKEDSNQYEVDNEFFVPHGYLSDGEGEEDQENEEETEVENKEKDETFQKERLKQKQEEFEMEMKQKTKQLKPKVYGCVWMGDRTSHQAYDQLLKILMPYKAMVLFGTCPIGLGGKEMNNQELKENDDEEGQEDDSGKKFLKSFPEKAVPDLIRLIHGNRHSKLFLRREFSEYWKKKREEETETDSGSIAMRKIEPKIQEISQYGRFSENGVSLKYRTWYVSKEIREKYGLEDLSLKNSWQYTLPVKEWKHESKEDKQKNPDESEEPAASKPQTKSPFIGTNLITKFTKVLNGEEEKKRLFNVTSNNIIQSPSSSDVSASPDNSGAINILPATPSSGKKNRNNSIVTMFKNIKKEKTVGEKISSPADKDEQLECITIE